MSNDAEKLADIATLINQTHNFDTVLDEPDISEVLIAKSGYGTANVNGLPCAVLPFDRLRDLNSNVAADCYSASQRAERIVRR